MCLQSYLVLTECSVKAVVSEMRNWLMGIIIYFVQGKTVLPLYFQGERKYSPVPSAKMKHEMSGRNQQCHLFISSEKRETWPIPNFIC